MDLSPQLIEVGRSGDAAGAVIVMHGGARRGGRTRVSPTQLSVLRMVPVAARIARAGRQRLAVYRLLNSARGWDTRHTPVHDVHWALEQVAARHGVGLPVCLVGHSLGGRAALLSSDRPQVHGVVALAPWVYADDLPHGAIQSEILIVHGDGDRVASPSRSAELARRLGRHARVAYVTVAGGRHAMLSRHGLFEGLAADFVSATLLGTSRTDTIARVTSGERWLTV